MKKIQVMILSISTLIASVGVQAEGLLGMESQPNTFDYNYVELNYVAIDDFGVGDSPLKSDLDGFRFKGSYDFDPNLSLIGSLTYADGKNTDLTIFSIGVAYHQKIPKTQLTDSDFIIHAEIESVDSDVDTSEGNKGDDDLGLLAGATARIKVVEKFEIFGDLAFRTVGDNDFLATVGGRYEFTPRLLGIASFEISETDTLSAGIRYNF